MIQKLLERYSTGAFTAQHLFIQCLHMIDPVHPDRVLAALPQRLGDQFARFIDEYRPGAMKSTYGVLPATDQVEAAKRWLSQTSSRVSA
jgi:hypothetical protein